MTQGEILLLFRLMTTDTMSSVETRNQTYTPAEQARLRSEEQESSRRTLQLKIICQDIARGK